MDSAEYEQGRTCGEYEQGRARDLQQCAELESAHNQSIQKHKARLNEQRKRSLATIESISCEIDSLESDPINAAIAELNQTGDRIRELQIVQEYILQAVQINQLCMLVDEQSSDLATASMAVDGLQQLLLMDIQFRGLAAQVTDIVSSFQSRLTADFATWLRDVMDRVNWPGLLSGESFELLLLTCQSYRLFELVCGTKGSACIEGLVRPIAIQFHFHFSCDRPTNRIDKPEWAFNFILGIISEQREFFVDLDEVLLAEGNLHLFIHHLVLLTRERFEGQKEAIMHNTLLPVIVDQILLFSEQLAHRFDYLDAQSILLDVFLSSASDLSAWIALEKSRLLDDYDDALASLTDYAHIDPIVDFLQSHFDYLKGFGNAGLQSQLLVNAFLPVLEQLLHKLEFSVPTLLSRPSDAIACCQLHNACSRLSAIIGMDWGADVSMVSLAQTPECQQLFGYDPSARIGSVFWKAVEVLDGLKELILGRLYSYLKDQPLSLMARWSSAMHYSKPDAPKDIHDSLRLALIEIKQRATLLKEHLHPPSLFAQHFARFVAELQEYVHFKLILRNYFTLQGAEAFAKDLETVDSYLTSVLPNDSWLLTGRLKDCVVLLQLPEADGQPSAMVLKRLLQNDRYSEATKLLHSLQVDQLTLAECEQVLASRH